MREKVFAKTEELADNIKELAEWHKKHPMPKNASLKERMKWHIAHSRHCNCRPTPASLLLEINKMGREVKDPDYTHKSS